MKYLINFQSYLIESLENNEDRIHYSPIEIIELKSFSQSTESDVKPIGLWYAFGENWNKFSDNFRENRYKYKVILKEGTESKILKITNMEELLDFIKEYIEPTGFKFKGSRSQIKWNEVAKKYSGFEFLNYDRDNIRNFYRDEDLVNKYKSTLDNKLDMSKVDFYFYKGYYDWAHYFDIVSGCIWDSSIIDSLEEIK